MHVDLVFIWKLFCRCQLLPQMFQCFIVVKCTRWHFSWWKLQKCSFEFVTFLIVRTATTNLATCASCQHNTAIITVQFFQTQTKLMKQKLSRYHETQSTWNAVSISANTHQHFTTLEMQLELFHKTEFTFKRERKWIYFKLYIYFNLDSNGNWSHDTHRTKSNELK